MTTLKLMLFVTCFWHTTLVHKNFTREVYLANQPKIGTKVHINGFVWKVKSTAQLCGRETK